MRRVLDGRRCVRIDCVTSGHAVRRDRLAGRENLDPAADRDRSGRATNTDEMLVAARVSRKNRL